MSNSIARDAKPGWLHRECSEVERCAICIGQFFYCGCLSSEQVLALNRLDEEGMWDRENKRFIRPPEKVTYRLDLPVLTRGEHVVPLADRSRFDGPASILEYAKSVVAKQLDEIAEKIKGTGVTVDARFEALTITGPWQVLQPLLANGLLIDDSESYCDDEYEHDEDDVD